MSQGGEDLSKRGPLQALHTYNCLSQPEPQIHMGDLQVAQPFSG